MPFCTDCGRRMTPDECGLCDCCLSDEWIELQRRAKLWDVDRLRIAGSAA